MIRPRRRAHAYGAPSSKHRAKIRCRPTTAAGILLLAPVLVVALLVPVVYPVDPFALVAAPLQAPGAATGLPLGTDFVGRDVLAGLAHGGRTTLAVGAGAALIAMALGVAVGGVAGLCGGVADSLLMRLTEFFQVLPALPFAMVALSLFGPSLSLVAISIGVASWPPLARLTRTEVMRIGRLGHVAAARAIGASPAGLLRRSILPHALPSLTAAGSLAVGAAILFEAALAFLGLGDPDTMSWGSMIGENRDFGGDAWWAVLAPGLAIFATVLGVGLIGDGLNDALDPWSPDR